MVEKARPPREVSCGSTVAEVSMFPKKRSAEVQDAANSAWDHARQAAAQVKPVAAQVKPLAASSGAAAKRGVRKTRAWAAPQVERTGQVLQDSVAPKVAAALSSAARRIEPPPPRRRPLRKLVGLPFLPPAAAGVAAFGRRRMKPDFTPSVAEGAPGEATPAATMQDGH